MDEDSSAALPENGSYDGIVLPEVEAFAFLLVVIYLIDADRLETVSHCPKIKTNPLVWS